MEVGEEWGPVEFTVYKDQLVRYAGASDDYNPIHYDDEVARSFGLPGVIVHGMLNVGLMMSFVSDNLPQGWRLKGCSMRFRQMVEPGRRLEMRARVRNIDNDLAGLEVELHERDQRPSITGRVTIEKRG